MEGILRIVYLADKEAFELDYIPSVISLKSIFEGIEALGKARELPYKCFVIPTEQRGKRGKKTHSFQI